MPKNIQEEEKRTEAATFKFKPSILHKLRYISVMDNPTQVDIMESALEDYIQKWEKKHGSIPARKK